MKRSKKSNRISWAPDVNLCQVRLFSSEDCPSQVGLEAQDHLQAKTSWTLHSNIVGYNERPPGFKGSHNVNQLKGLSHIPQIKWKCPPKSVLNHNWHVAAGEESKEAEDQKQREMRVLEAVYPCLSAIPPSPSVSLDMEEYPHDDCHTPLIPIIPIEDEVADLPSDLEAPINTSISLQPPALPQGLLASETLNTSQCNSPAAQPPASEKPELGMLPGLEADVIAAASAAFTAIMKSKEQGSLIDTNLLINILSNPKMIEKLLNEYGAYANTGTAPTSGSKPVTPLVALSSPKHGVRANTVTAPTSGSKPVTPSVPLSSPKPDMVLSGLKLVTPSFPLSSSKPEMIWSASKPVAPSVPLSSQKPTMVLSMSKPVTPSVQLSSPKPDMVLSVSKPVSPPVPLSSLEPDMILSVSKPVTSSVPLSSLKRDMVLSGSKPGSVSKPVTPSVPLSSLKRDMVLSVSKPVTASFPLSPRLTNGNVYPERHGAQPTLNTMPPSPETLPISSISARKAPPVKDINYYKSLVKQHGGERQERLDQILSQYGNRRNYLQEPEQVQNFKPRESKPKIQKPCIYFNSSKGCRHGSNCPYQHDMSFQWRKGSVLGVQSAKRMKLSREITGRT